MRVDLAATEPRDGAVPLSSNSIFTAAGPTPDSNIHLSLNLIAPHAEGLNPLVALAEVSDELGENQDMSEGTIAKGHSARRSKKTAQQHTKKTATCIFCYFSKRKCDSSSRCLQCLVNSIPAHMCVRVRFADEPVFKKWNVGIYQSQMRWSDMAWLPGDYAMNLFHYRNGPRFPVVARQFLPTSVEQTQVWGKLPTGWRSEQTAAFGLSSVPSDESIAAYVTACIPYCASEASKNVPQLSSIIQNASPSNKLLPIALRLWTANCLLMKGWDAPENPDLGIFRVLEPSSPYYNTTPAPRVLQNQIDSRLEAYVAQVELQLLKELQKAMKQKTCSWVEIFSTVFLILRVAEKDIWRLMYWLKHDKEAYKWKHPESASHLVQRSIYCCNLLLAHLHCAGSMPAEFHSSEQPPLERFGRAVSLYRETNDGSLDDTLSSLVFVPDWKNGWVVRPSTFGCK